MQFALFGYLIASTAAVILFAVDKAAACTGRRRVPESTLHIAELLGGWPGALFAIACFRHKSSKPRYLAVTGAIILAHAAAWAFFIWSS